MANATAKPFRRIDGRGDAPRVYKLAPPLVQTPVDLLSVTSILSALPKPALKSWGERLVAEAAMDGIASGVLAQMDPDEALEWLRQAPFRTLQRAGKRGTQIHLIAEMVLTGRVEPGTSEWAKHVMTWADEWIGELIAVEQAIVHLDDEWAGTADLIFRDKQGTIWLGDWKSSKDVYPDFALQLGAYANKGAQWVMNPYTADPLMIAPFPIERVAILHINDAGVTFYEPDTTLDRLYEDFMAVHRTWHALRGIEKIRMSQHIGPPRPTIEEYVVHLRGRCVHAQSEKPQFARLLASLWPASLPTLKSGNMRVLRQCEQADDIITACERDLDVTFGAVPPLLAKT